jgi:septal ring factor EnvC (AmiA/AmiB activator)
MAPARAVKTENEKRMILSLENLARVAQHAILVITVVSLCFGPLWNSQVAQPMEALKARTEKLEQALEAQNKQIASIDKNLAIMTERLTQIKDALDKYFKRIN